MKKIILCLTSLVLVFVMIGTVNAVETIYVDDDCGTIQNGIQSNPYCTINDALVVANDGDTIIVAAGTYDEQILIDGVNIFLIANEGAIIKPTSCVENPTKKHIIQIYNSISTVDGFIIDANYDISGCLDGIYAKGGLDGYGSVDLIIINNDVYDYGKNGITVNGAEATAVIEDNIVTGRGVLTVGDYAQNGIQFGYGAIGIITGNTISDNYYDGYWAGTGILLYNVNQKTLNLPVPILKADNIFSDNEFDVKLIYWNYYNQGGPLETVEIVAASDQPPQPQTRERTGEKIGEPDGHQRQNRPGEGWENENDLLENAVEVSPGVFYIGESMDKGQVVEGYAFVHYMKPAASSKPIWDDTVEFYKFMFGGIKWTDMMTYEVNTDYSGLDPSEVMTILGDSLNTWDGQTSFELFNEPINLMTMQNPGENDGHNIVVWSDLGSGGIIAYNSLWFNKAMNVIIDSDVVFNTQYIWDDCVEGVDCSNKMDLQNIATHEFGHNGLNDLYMPKSVELTMHGYSSFGENKKRNLGIGDILGIQELYGE
ncbi:matrixin family metalloprotease [archaeon]|nr:matrixin family metalloprotease [archaeon]